MAVISPQTKNAPIASYRLYPLAVASTSAKPAVDHEVATGYLNFQDSMSPESPIPKPSAQNQELICTAVAPKSCAA